MPYNAGDTGLIPGRGGKSPHAPGELSPRASTKGSACHSEGPTCCNRDPTVKELNTKKKTLLHMSACPGGTRGAECGLHAKRGNPDDTAVTAGPSHMDAATLGTDTPGGRAGVEEGCLRGGFRAPDVAFPPCVSCSLLSSTGPADTAEQRTATEDGVAVRRACSVQLAETRAGRRPRCGRASFRQGRELRESVSCLLSSV